MQLYIVLKNKFLGTLSESTDSFKFIYSDKISPENYVLGLTNKENISSYLFPIFDDLIPENKDKLDSIKANHNVKGTIEILLYLDNIHGSFEFYKSYEEIPLNITPNIIQYKEVKFEILGSYEYPEILDGYQLEAIPKHNNSNFDTTALGLSGHQEKHAVIKDDLTHMIKYAGNNNQTEYFIKPLNINFSHFEKGKIKFKEYKELYYPYLLINEHIFMSLAKNFGFEVPYNALIKDNKYNEYHLIIKRFDRYKTIYKFDHHTLNSLLGKVSAEKDNVTIIEVIEAIKDLISSEDMLTLFKFIVFSVIISHGDLHSKNISLIYCSNKFEDKTLTLAPMYDILTTNIYNGAQKEHDIGMFIFNKRNKINANNLVDIASRMDISNENANNIIENFSNNFLTSFESHIEKLPEAIKALRIKKSDYNSGNSLRKEYTLYFRNREKYIRQYLLDKSTKESIFQ